MVSTWTNVLIAVSMPDANVSTCLPAAAMLSCNAVVKDEQAASERPVPCGALSVTLRILAAVECASLAALCASAVSTTRFILRGYSGVFDLSMV